MISEQKENDDEREVPSDKPVYLKDEVEMNDDSFTEEEFKRQYRDLPVWKQVILLILFLGAMVTVITLINFIVDFGAELIKLLVQK